MIFAQRLTWLAFGYICLAGAGCSSGPQPVPVEGVVTLDGKPVAGAEVTFILDGKNGAAPRAKTDAAGAFVVNALPDNYKVTVFKLKDGPNPMFSELPARYQQPTTSPFSVTVPPSEKLTLALVSDQAG